MSEAALVLLILIMAANSAPVVLARLAGNRWAAPIDGGKAFVDGRPLFGNSKTWRGLASAVAVCALIAPAFGFSAAIGAAAGTLAMAGDLLSSFTKRRLGMPSSSQAFLLDQVPETLLPAWALKSVFALSWGDIAAIIAIFIALEVVLSIVFYRLGIRKRPY